MKKITLFLLFFIGCDNNPIINKNGLKTQNVILITLDGVRWQEVFQGADKRI
ncbi:MAG: phosphoglyceromutase, partial [Candidatus Marinimicrobia bacterium]|nr:phosphoglyceromutase [Candidatus Neomarinimicrobiota bacterium]